MLCLPAKVGGNVGSCHQCLLLVIFCLWNKTVDVVGISQPKLVTCDVLQGLVSNERHLVFAI